MKKKLLSGLLAVLALSLLCIPALAAPVPAAGKDAPGPSPAVGELWAPTSSPAPPYTIVVGEKELDLGALPVPAFEPNAPGGAAWTVMVPLRLIGEALGYEVGWDPATGTVTLEDGIQKAALLAGDRAAAFTGKLTIINLDREVELLHAPVILQGTTYVPVEFFEEFLNTVSIEEAPSGRVITIAPQTAEICETAE